MSTHATKRHPKFCNNSVSQFFAHAAIKTETTDHNYANQFFSEVFT